MGVDGKQIYRKLDSIIGKGPDKKSYLGDDDYVEVLHRNIRLSFHLKNPLVDLAKLLGTIRRIHEKIERHLHWTATRIEVEIYQSREQWIERHTRINEQDLPSWVQADSGRVIRIYTDSKTDTLQKLQLVITHECVHAALGQMTGVALPAWLDEGLAVYLSQELPAEYQLHLKAAVDQDAVLPLELLEKPFTRLERKVQKLAYAQSSSMIGFMVEKYDWNMIRQLIAALGRGDGLDAALGEFGLTAYLLEKEWKQSVRGIV